MALAARLRPWSGVAYRHIPAASPFGVLDFRHAGAATDNRWNAAGQPTLYLAGDRGVALAEFARHFREERTAALATGLRERALFRLDVRLDAVFDLTQRDAWQALGLTDAPACFLDRRIARATADFLRQTTGAQALRVPSVAFLDAPERSVLVLFLEQLPTDVARFIPTVEAAGTFRVTP